MKVAVWHNLPSGGGKRALYEQVRGLVSRGHKVEVWCPPTADRSYLPLSTIVPEHVVPLKLRPYPEATRSGLLQTLHPLRWNAWARLRAMDEHCMECARQIRSESFDLLFAACCFFFHTPQIGRFVDIPSIVYLQEPNRPVYEAQPDLPWLAISWTARDLLDVQFWRRALRHEAKLLGTRVLAREERKNALAFSEILVNSFFSRESVLRAFGVDSKVCYLGVDTDKFVDQKKPRERFVVAVGALIASKNVEFLIESMARVRRSSRPLLVLIANTIDPTYLARIQKQAAEADVSFELKHRIDDSELLDLLNRARMMLYAPRLEPFGFAPLEASACGLPVVAVAEGGVRETVQHGVNGIVVEPEPEAMACAIERLLADDDLHWRLSVRAAEFAREKWSLQASIDRLETALLAQLNKNPTKVLRGNTVEDSAPNLV